MPETWPHTGHGAWASRRSSVPGRTRLDVQIGLALVGSDGGGQAGAGQRDDVLDSQEVESVRVVVAGGREVGTVGAERERGQGRPVAMEGDPPV